MKKLSKPKRILITSVHIITILNMLFWTWFMIAMTPYQDWAPDLMYIDEDKLLVLKMFCMFNLMFNAVASAISMLYSKTFFVTHLILSQIYIVYLCWLASI